MCHVSVPTVLCMLLYKSNDMLGLKCPVLIQVRHGFYDRLLLVLTLCPGTVVCLMPRSLLFCCLLLVSSISIRPRFGLFCLGVALSMNMRGYQRLSFWQHLLTRWAFYWLSAFNLDNPCIISWVSIFRQLSSCGCASYRRLITSTTGSPSCGSFPGSQELTSSLACCRLQEFSSQTDCAGIQSAK